MDPVKTIIKNGIKDGEFKQVDIELTITTMLGTIHYLLTFRYNVQKDFRKKRRL